MNQKLAKLQRMKQLLQGDLADVQGKIESHRYEHPKLYKCSTCGDEYTHDQMWRHSVLHCAIDQIYVEEIQ